MKFLGIIGLIIALVGSIFAAYDNFVFLNTLNSRYIPPCKRWNNILSKIEPYTINSRVPIEKMAPFCIFESKEKEFKILLHIIKMNTKISADSNTAKITLSVPVINSGTRLGGSVSLEVDNQVLFVTTPDILAQWIKDFRKTWFLKWGLLLLATGTLLRLLKEINFLVRSCHPLRLLY